MISFYKWFVLCRWIDEKDESIYFPTVKMKRSLPISVTTKVIKLAVTRRLVRVYGFIIVTELSH